MAEAHRSPDQVADELAMGHVSAVLRNLDWTVDRARQALEELRRSGSVHSRNAEFALEDLIRQLEPARKRFVQDAYFPAEAARLL